MQIKRNSRRRERKRKKTRVKYGKIQIQDENGMKTGRCWEAGGARKGGRAGKRRM